MSLGVFHLFQTLLPCGKLFLHFVLGDAVQLLDFSGQVVAFARNHVKLIVGKLAPLLLDVTLELFPITFDAIPVHVGFP